MVNNYADKIEEFDNLMQAGIDELAVGDNGTATDYFSDAAYIIKDLSDELKEELCNKYEVNPLDYAK
jgi:hypothetical protein